MNMRINSCLMVLVIIASLTFVENAPGYGYRKGNGTKIKWEGENIRWRAASNSFPGGSSYRTALNRAISRWNQAPGEFHFKSVTWGDTNIERKNKQTEIWFSDTLGSGSATCYTWLKWRWGKATIKEADIALDVDVPWSTSTIQSNKDVAGSEVESYQGKAYGGNRRTFVTTALHEMGHAMGLQHENRRLNIMGSDTSHLHANNKRIRAYVGEDAGNGEVYLYGRTDTILKNDLSVSHWKFWKAGGTDNEYSQHIFTKIYHISTGNPVYSKWYEGVKRYRVKKGTTYHVQFTYENNGYYTQNGVNIGFYISKNRNITTLDERFATRTMNLTRNRPYTKKLTLTIPSNLTVTHGYWLGVIIDYTGSIQEFDEHNNAAYIPIEIIP
ncbi:MAG: matrixin family metalloprotease [Planctomycetes bacterium]|nr:matrixin family metalloprotease [Planctomycetota bacterium]